MPEKVRVRLVAGTAYVVAERVPHRPYRRVEFPVVVFRSEVSGGGRDETVNTAWVRSEILRKLGTTGVRGLEADGSELARKVRPRADAPSLGVVVEAQVDPSTGLYSGEFRTLIVESKRSVARQGRAPIPRGTRTSFLNSLADLLDQALARYLSDLQP